MFFNQSTKEPMYKKLLFSLFLVTSISSIYAQNIIKSSTLNVDIEESLKTNIYSSLDSLFSQIAQGQINDTFIHTEKADLTKAILSYLKGIENNKEKNIPNFYQKELLNLYPIGNNQFSLQIAYLGYDKEISKPTIRMILNLIAKNDKEHIRFALPLAHTTKDWKTKTIGHINYHFRDNIQIERAELFDKKNTTIANKLGVQAESFDFYMCDHYQEILSLLGVTYDVTENGQFADGFGVQSGHIFAIQNNEDFSHDIFHYYSGQINKNRNWITEEGIAYSWGNAYYTDATGNMINQAILVQELKKYLKKHPEQSIYDLFENNTKIFNHLSPKISVRSTISSLLCDEIERQKGAVGITKIITCGKRTATFEHFFAALDELIGINKTNFDKAVNQLIMAY